MPTVRVVEHTPMPPERVLEAARDFSERRADLWPEVHLEHLNVHEAGETFADVTEGNPWPIGYVWERLRYEWSMPDSVKGVVTDSNLLQARRLLAPFFPLGLAKRTVGEHLRHFLSRVEDESSSPARFACAPPNGG